MSSVYAVSEITAAVKGLLEQEFPFIWVKGQISNLSRPRSGHVYFTLKDESAALAVVWFKGSRKRAGGDGVDPLTGEVSLTPLPGLEKDPADKLSEGQEVMAGGRLTVYAQRGQHQLVAELVQDVGVGKLHLEFEALKQKFAALGYFAPERKRPLPPHPERVAVVTAPGSAAMRDFVRLAADRGRPSAIRIHPALVQGDEAPAQIAAQLEAIASEGWAQVAVVIRGGGSIEDLWAFNTEPVADAIFHSPVPVLAGVGHEVDVTIADMVADVRASTPSHAAQLLWVERRELIQEVDELELDLTRAWERYEQRLERELSGLERELALLSPMHRLARWTDRFESLAERLQRATTYLVQDRTAALASATERLHRAGPAWVQGRETALERLALRLEGLNPESPLERGYCLARVGKTGKFLRSIENVQPGDALELHVRDGAVEAEVKGVRGDA